MPVVGEDERKCYTDDADVIFAALHEWGNVKERRRVEVFGGAGNGRVLDEDTGENVELVPNTPSGRFYGGPGPDTTSCTEPGSVP